MSGYNRSVFQALSMIGQFGINMLVPVFICAFLGMFLDKKLGTSYFVIILFFVGAVAGFRNIYMFSKKIFEKQSSESAYLHKKVSPHKTKSGKAIKEIKHENSHHEDK